MTKLFDKLKKMLKKDVVVKRSEGTKIYRRRGCVYVYYVIGSEYKKDKQYVAEKRVCIGKMIDDENMNPNDNFYRYFDHPYAESHRRPASQSALNGSGMYNFIP